VNTFDARVQAKWVAHAGMLWQAAADERGRPPSQFDYVTVISKLLRLRCVRLEGRQPTCTLKGECASVVGIV
jgi:hypothetical protein